MASSIMVCQRRHRGRNWGLHHAMLSPGDHRTISHVIPAFCLPGTGKGTHVQPPPHPPVTFANLPIQTHETFWTFRASMSCACVPPHLRFDLSTTTAGTLPRKARDDMGGFDPASCSGAEGASGGLTTSAKVFEGNKAG